MFETLLGNNWEQLAPVLDTYQKQRQFVYRKLFRKPIANRVKPINDL